MGGRPVALKVSLDQGCEPAIIGCLDHPRIMPAYSVCRDAPRGLRGLCMPYRSGAPLDAVLRRAWPVRDSHGASAFQAMLPGGWDGEHGASLDRPGWIGFPSSGTYDYGAAWILLVVAQAVAYIHSRNFVHSDIKPSNVYIGARDGPLLFDFGFARSPSVANPLLGGTPAYMAPVQLRAFLDPKSLSEVGPFVDTYALGLTLLELLFGTLPDMPKRELPPAGAVQELLSVRSRADWLTGTLSQIRPPLRKILELCLAPAPEERYAEVSELARSLEQFLLPPTGSSASPSREPTTLAAYSFWHIAPETIPLTRAG